MNGGMRDVIGAWPMSDYWVYDDEGNYDKDVFCLPPEEVYDDEDEEEDEEEEEDEIYDENTDNANVNTSNNTLDNDENTLDNKKSFINYKNNVNFLFEDVDIEKFNTEYKTNVLNNHHNECLPVSKDEVDKLIIVHRNSDNIIIDQFHKTIPILTKYEKTKLLGLRVVQLNNNANPYFSANQHMSSIEIANREIELKLIPLIIKRPLSNNKFEYWKLKDLEIL